MKQGFAVHMKSSPLLINDILRIKPVETKILHTNVNVVKQKMMMSHHELQKTR